MLTPATLNRVPVMAINAKERRKLQAMIDRTVRTCAVFYEAQRKLNDWTRNRYGVEPGDIDADQIIDGVFGGGGVPGGITADEFDRIMTEGSGA